MLGKREMCRKGRNMDGKWEETKALMQAIVNRKMEGLGKAVRGQTQALRKMQEKLEMRLHGSEANRPRASIAVMESGKGAQESDKATVTPTDLSASPRLPLSSSDSQSRSPPSPLSSVEAEILALESLHSPSELQPCPPFRLSLGLRNALSMLTCDLPSDCPIAYQPEAIRLYRLFCGLQGLPVSPLDGEVWQECQSCLALDSSLKPRLLTSIAHFDFSYENLNRLPGLLSDLPVSCQTWQPAAVLHRVVLEAAAYAGLLPDKEPVCRRYERLLRLREERRSR